MPTSLFTSESVTEGHPDKICDQISDAILDAIMAKDRHCRVACETFTKTGFVIIGGEITTRTYVDFPQIVRETIRDIGYSDSAMGFDWETCGVMSAIEQQSPDIAQGVDRGSAERQGAGDQGLMFGYASNETEELMPMPIMTAHKLAMRLAEVRKKKIGGIDWLRPDGKTQVSVRYEDGRVVGIENIVVSTQHRAGVSQKQIEEAIRKHVIKAVVPAALLKKTKFHINPTGKFVVGGPMGDAGLTGRKIIVDTYGGTARHGGGAFSGKDPSKVDRSAAYYARYIAKHVVAAKLAERCEVQLAYAIGVARPVSMLVDTFGTGVISNDKLSRAVARVFDARPGLVVEELKLRRPVFRDTAAYGHFGRTGPGFTWEKTPRVRELLDASKAGALVGPHTARNGVTSKKVNGVSKNGTAAKNGVAARNGAAAKNGVAAKNGAAKNGVHRTGKAGAARRVGGGKKSVRRATI